jgi:hypothetical protein
MSYTVQITEVSSSVEVTSTGSNVAVTSSNYPITISVDSLATGLPGPAGAAGVPGPQGPAGVPGDVTNSNVSLGGSTVTVQDAITELANRFFQQTTAPSSGINPGDLWYDLTNNVMNVREGLSWVPMVVSPDLATTSLNGGYF